MKLSIVIPVYNEAQTVRELLWKVFHQSVPCERKEMIIVESASTDGSRDIVLAFANEANEVLPGSVKVILQERPRGKGHAMRAGFKMVSGDIILIQDADLEYDSADYPELLQPILDGKAEFVLGSRHLGVNQAWKIRKFEKDQTRAFLMNLGGVFFHGFFNVVYGVRLTDPTTMYKVFKTKCISGLTFTACRFDFDYELTGKLIRSGYKPVEVPASYVSRGFEEGKKIRVFRDPLTWVIAILKYRFAPLSAPSLVSDAVGMIASSEALNQ